MVWWVVKGRRARRAVPRRLAEHSQDWLCHKKRLEGKSAGKTNVAGADVRASWGATCCAPTKTVGRRVKRRVRGGHGTPLQAKLFVADG